MITKHGFELFCLTSTYVSFQVHFADTFEPKIISFPRGLHMAKNLINNKLGHVELI